MASARKDAFMVRAEPAGGEAEGDGEGLGLEVGLVVGVEGVSGLGLVVGVEGVSGLGLSSGEEGVAGDPGCDSGEGGRGVTYRVRGHAAQRSHGILENDVNHKTRSLSKRISLQVR